MDRDHLAVHSWLSSILDDDVPSFEVNKKTVYQIHKCMIQNQEMDRIGLIALANIKEQVEAYKSEANHLRDIIEAVGMSPHSLSNAGKGNLRNLSQLACTMKIKNVSNSSYVLGLSHLHKDLGKIKKEVMKEKGQMEKFKLLNKECMQRMKNILSYYQKIEESSFIGVPLLEKRKNDTKMFHEKSKNYENLLKNFQGQEEEGHKHLQHDVLLQIAQKLDEMKNELTPLQKKHGNYKSLPPDVNLATVKIEETKRDLMRLERQFQTDLDLLAL